MDANLPPDEPLPYPTRPLFFPDGSCVEEFIIPEEDKELVLQQLYPFQPVPKMTDIMYDLHADKTFRVKDFRVTWEHGMNYLVSPYYPESGGTVIDWMDESAASPTDSWEEDAYDGSSKPDSFDDLDTDGFDDQIDDSNPPG